MNHPQALYTLSQMLEYGDGIERDLYRAKELYRRLMDNPESNSEQREFAESKLLHIDEKIRAKKHLEKLDLKSAPPSHAEKVMYEGDPFQESVL
jgi:TPR repeat protein